MGLEAGGRGGTKKKEKKKEKIPHMWMHRSSAPSGPLPKKETRPDTQHHGRGRLGRGSNEKNFQKLLGEII